MYRYSTNDPEESGNILVCEICNKTCVFFWRSISQPWVSRQFLEQVDAVLQSIFCHKGAHQW